MGEWPWPKLDEIVEERRGSAKIVGDREYELWSVPSFSRGTPELVPGETIGSAKRRVMPGDVLLCKINPRINRVWVVEPSSGPEQIASTEWMALRPRDFNVISPRWLQQYLSSPAFREWIVSDVSGATGSHTRAKPREILKQPIPLPLLPEQERIVAILDEAFAAIATATANAERGLSCGGALLVSRLAQVFGTPSSTWVQAPLAELAAQSLGKMLDKQKNRGEFHPYLRNQNVRWFGFDLSSVFEMRFEESERERYTAAVGDLLICEGGYPGRAAIWPGPDPIHFQKAVHRVRFHEPRHTKWFLYFLYYLDSSGDIRKHFTGTGIQHLTGRSLAKVVVPIPPSEQIAAHLASFDAMRSEADRLSGVYERRAALLTELKQSILHKAFTGELTADFNAADVALSKGEV